MLSNQIVRNSCLVTRFSFRSFLQNREHRRLTVLSAAFSGHFLFPFSSLCFSSLPPSVQLRGNNDSSGSAEPGSEATRVAVPLFLHSLLLFGHLSLTLTDLSPCDDFISAIFDCTLKSIDCPSEGSFYEAGWLSPKLQKKSCCVFGAAAAESDLAKSTVFAEYLALTSSNCVRCQKSFWGRAAGRCKQIMQHLMRTEHYHLDVTCKNNYSEILNHEIIVVFYRRSSVCLIFGVKLLDYAY